MAISKFNKLVKNAIIEREVEDVYNRGINLYFPGVDITHPFACDGLVDTKTDSGKLLKLIIEYKLDEDLQSRMARAKVIIQVLYYLKRFENDGLILPNVCMIGDKNECFVFHTNDIIGFLDEDTDWSYAPSSAHIKNPDFVLKIASDDKFNPFIFQIDDNFSFKAVADKIKDLAANVQRYVHITEHNIATIYDTFLGRVIKNTKKYNSKELVSIFLGIITNGDEYYKHPSKRNTLVTPKGMVEINGDKFDSFFSYFQKNYTPQEITKFTEIADRLIEDTERRNSGDFWTPTLFVDYAHKMISEQFGEDWKEKYVVFDCACGTKNLTRDYKFSNLYCSTLFDSELEMSKQYNKEATTFQFDFLNDPEDKLPESLIEHFKNNDPIMFFINPPYACNGAMMGEGKGNGVTNVKKEMVKNSIDGAKELYNQFLYRIINIKQTYHLTNCNICIFCNPGFITKSSYKKFRNLFLDNFKFENGIMFNASEFADCSNKWGITFNLWSTGTQEQRNDFIHTLVKRNDDNEIVSIGEKDLYNIDGCKDINDWLYSVTNGKPSRNVEWVGYRSTPLEITEGTKINKDTIGVIANTMTCVNLSNIFFTGNNGGRFLITKENLPIACAHFFVRSNVTEKSWINDKDEYLAPDENNVLYKQFLMDCVVYSLFVSQVSLRNIELSKKWNIKNEFFWMSKQEMEELANTYSNQDCYNDVHTDSDRYVYKYLQEHYNELSDDAKDVLESARELIRKSFKYRAMFDEEESKYQINNWDCGWYQIKALLKMYMPDDLKAFQNKYKAFANRLRPLVYELGFLKK